MDRRNSPPDAGNAPGPTGAQRPDPADVQRPDPADVQRPDPADVQRPDPPDAQRLSHIDDRGEARMVDVADRQVTVRTAVATGVVRTRAAAAIAAGTVAKGDVLATARIAGIMAAKRTSNLIPMCHPIAVHGVSVDLEVGAGSVAITATVRTADRTGVEMEALTAVTVAALTVVDMTKSADPAATIDGVRLESKTGGRSGQWHR